MVKLRFGISGCNLLIMLTNKRLQHVVCISNLIFIFDKEDKELDFLVSRVGL